MLHFNVTTVLGRRPHKRFHAGTQPLSFYLSFHQFFSHFYYFEFFITKRQKRQQMR